MKILRVIFDTANIEEMKWFYHIVLEMPIVREGDSFFTVQAGKSQLTFQQAESVSQPFYHFAVQTNHAYFDYMYNKLLESKTTMLPDESGNTSLYWKGKQVYFKDPDGNIVEILERESPYLLEKKGNGWHHICEVGMPTPDVQLMCDFLNPILNSNPLGSDTFQFYGNEWGNFVIVREGRNWYPTEEPAIISPITIEVEGDTYHTLTHPTLPYKIKVKQKWSKELPVVQMRVARPTDKLNEIIEFYEHGLGLTRIGEFFGHDGYDGVMYGLPHAGYHLEFTSHIEGTPCLSPTKDNLLVFYIQDPVAIEEIVTRIRSMGYKEVEPENPYWKEKGITIEDPDGWRIVLFQSTGL